MRMQIKHIMFTSRTLNLAKKSLTQNQLSENKLKFEFIFFSNYWKKFLLLGSNTYLPLIFDILTLSIVVLKFQQIHFITYSFCLNTTGRVEENADPDQIQHSAASDLVKTVCTGLSVPLLSVITVFLGFLFQFSN